MKLETNTKSCFTCDLVSTAPFSLDCGSWYAYCTEGLVFPSVNLAYLAHPSAQRLPLAKLLALFHCSLSAINILFSSD